MNEWYIIIIIIVYLLNTWIPIQFIALEDHDCTLGLIEVYIIILLRLVTLLDI